MTNTNLIDFITFVGPTETLIEGGRVLEVSGFAGSGDVVGPAGAVDEQIAVYDGTSGKLIKDGGYTIADLIAMMGGASTTMGEATVSFGATPTDSATIAVVGQAAILATSKVDCWIQGATTGTNTEQDHIQAGALMRVTSNIPTAATGFTIYCEVISGLVTGDFKIQWRWS